MLCLPLLRAEQAAPAPQQAGGIEVSGQVVDEQDNPLIGVNAGVKGTTIGTITDIDGNFSLRVTNGNAVLVFSYIGYQQQEY
ncbi:MAG: carboxypeptidase-like regulatory domain-containing protein [Tannerellaceae bacterium]|nr:carboxypeptidase-like regulatory domain-containing protein [Tannerellaceae bacterium]